jgi:hypothetical protein
MEFDSSTIVYVIAVIVYFLYSTFFNKKVPEQDARPTEQTDTQPRKTVSFDELLKEIRREQGQLERDMEGTSMEEEKYVEEERYVPEARQKKETRSVIEPAPPKYFTYEDPEQFPSPDDTYRNRHKSYQKYEKQPLVKLDDQVDLESDEKILGEVEDVAGTSRGRNKYAALLKNPETVREAIIVSEILRRKHF